MEHLLWLRFGFIGDLILGVQTEKNVYMARYMYLVGAKELNQIYQE
jgi:hypothetical protein